MNSRYALCISLLAAGCLDAPELSDDPAPREDSDTVPVDGDAEIWFTTVNATSETEWVDFQPEGEEGDWVLRFRRMNVALNGGVSGDLGYEAVAIEAPIDAIEALPQTGWHTDGEGEDGAVEYALEDWYDYDLATHTLTPRPLTWALSAPGHPTLLLAFDSYYDDAGTPAVVSFYWTFWPSDEEDAL